MTHLITGPIPVALIAVQGVLTIAFTGANGRGYTHRLLLTLVLVENVGALLLRRRHPLLALAALSLVYAIVDYPLTTLPAVLLALLTVLVTRDRRTGRLSVIIAAAVLSATLAIHGDPARQDVGGKSITIGYPLGRDRPIATRTRDLPTGRPAH